ncbi:MAG: glycosyltransferase family 4 protein [Candidatus Omnitrophica bacterium]|nr:glycosyltransferase family 4 protein [Candidatus Omnitrophota bacterium]
MKILFVHNYYQTPGGEDIVLKNEEVLFKSYGHAVTYYTRHNDEIKQYTFWQKIKFFYQTIYSVKTCREVSKLIDENKPDVALVSNVFPLISPSVYDCLKKNNIPIVQLVQNQRFLCPSGLFFVNGMICERCKSGGVWNCVLRKCYKKSYALSILYALTILIHRVFKTFQRNIDIFITSNHFFRNKLIEGGFPAEKIVVEGNGIRMNALSQKTRPGDYAVYMGRISAEKGLLTLLKAYKKLPHRKLVIMGSGDFETQLQMYISQNNMANVDMKGFISGDSRFDFIRNARFTILPTECYENFGMSVLESFAVGTPVIVSNIGGLPELVIEGKNGLLFEPGNVDDLTQKIDYLCENDSIMIEMSNYARQYVDDTYRADKHYERLTTIFNKAIATARPTTVQPAEINACRDG